MITPGSADGADLREELGIPREATVFGRYGGLHTFNLGAARQAVAEVSRLQRSIYFVFMNTQV
jgi:hypothetical protein